MTLPELTTCLDALDIRLSLRLVVDARRGAVTPEVKAALQAHRSALLVRLARDTQWAELTALRWGPAVGDPEPGIIIDRPDPARKLAAPQAADDPDTIAGRLTIQAESES